MRSTDLPQLSRRAVLSGAGVGAAALLTACTSDGESATSDSPQTVPTTIPSVDPLGSLVATTRLHVLNLQAAVAIDTERQALLSQLLEDRQAHFDALIEEWSRTDPEQAKAQAAITGQVPTPDEVDAAIGQVRTDATEARTQFTDILGSVSRRRAALFGSIAANIETHRVVLA